MNTRETTADAEELTAALEVAEETLENNTASWLLYVLREMSKQTEQFPREK